MSASPLLPASLTADATTIDADTLGTEAPMMSSLQVPALMGRQGDTIVCTFTMTLKQFGALRNLVDVTAAAQDRAQRDLNKARARRIITYLRTHADSFILPPVLMVADLSSADELPHFEPNKRSMNLGMQSAAARIAALAASLDEQAAAKLLADVELLTHGEPDRRNHFSGRLTMPAGVVLRLLDGQHRHFSITEVCDLARGLGRRKTSAEDEAIYQRLLTSTITVELRWSASIADVREHLPLSQRWFRDVNHLGKSVSSSLAVTYDHDDPIARLTREIANDVFGSHFIEWEKSSVSKKSTKWFPLARLSRAVKASVPSNTDLSDADQRQRVVAAWKQLKSSVGPWIAVMLDGMASVVERRKHSLAFHAIFLDIVAELVKHVLHCENVNLMPDEERSRLFKSLGTIDWMRSNPEVARRMLVNGRLMTSGPYIQCAKAYLFRNLSLALTPQMHAAERQVLPPEEK